MMQVTRCLLAIFCGLVWVSSCKKGGEGGAPDKKGGPAAAGKGAEAAALTVGMTDPFPRLSGPAGRAYERAWKAARAKKADEAAAAFAEVVAAAPDLTTARYQLALALTTSGKLAEAREQIVALLARDYVGYARSMDRSKAWKPLRDSPEWAAVKQAAEQTRVAYAQGLDMNRGFVFVARMRAAKATLLANKDLVLNLNQEVFHYDPQTARYRRLTATSGQVLAAMRSPDGKLLAFVTANKVNDDGSGERFADLAGGYVDLATLEVVGPFELAGRFHEVSIGFSPAGPVWSTESAPGQDGGTFVIDTARTGMAKSSVAVEGERTWAQTGQVWHSGKDTPERVKLAADQRSFTIEGGGTVTSARELSPSALEWSPGKRRLAYAGRLDACKALAEGDKSKNELFVYDVEKKSAQRIDSGISEFETLWLSDDLLVYENGVGQKGTVNLYDFAAHKKIQLSTRHGAGLYGVPSLRCEKTEEKDETPEEESTD